MFGNFGQSDWAFSNFNISSRVSRLEFLRTTLRPWRMSGNGGTVSEPLNSEAQILLRWSESLNVTLLPVCDGIPQCHRGFIKPQESGHRVRMNVGSRGSRRAPPTLASEHRSVRNPSQLSDPSLLFANQQSHGGGVGRVSSNVGRSLGLCVTSLCSDQGGHQEAPVISQHLPDTHRSVVASKGMVPGSSGVSVGTSSCSSSSSRPTMSTSFSSVSSAAPRASASRVETVERFAREVRVSRQVAQCHHASSQRLYQHRWKCYRQWCASQGHTVSTPSITKIADFFFLPEERKRFVSFFYSGFPLDVVFGF